MRSTEQALKRAQICAGCDHLGRFREPGDRVSGRCKRCPSKCAVMVSDESGEIRLTVSGNMVRFAPWGHLVHGGKCPIGKWDKDPPDPDKSVSLPS